MQENPLFSHYLMISKLIPKPLQLHIFIVIPLCLACHVYLMCSSLLHDACFQRDHRTNLRPIPVYQWPLISHGDGRASLPPGGSGGPQYHTLLWGLSVSTVCELDHSTHQTSGPPQVLLPCHWFVWCPQLLEKHSKLLPAVLVSSRSCMSVVCVLDLA